MTHGSLDLSGSLLDVGTLSNCGSLLCHGTLIQAGSLLGLGTLTMRGSLSAPGTLKNDGSLRKYGTLPSSGFTQLHQLRWSGIRHRLSRSRNAKPRWPASGHSHTHGRRRGIRPSTTAWRRRSRAASPHSRGRLEGRRQHTRDSGSPKRCEPRCLPFSSPRAFRLPGGVIQVRNRVAVVALHVEALAAVGNRAHQDGLPGAIVIARIALGRLLTRIAF